MRQGAPAQDLLERQYELEQIAEALAHARAGTGRLVLTEGAAGVGKTELLRAAGRTARETGMRVLNGRGVELESDHAFGVARQLLAPLLREAGDDVAGLLSGPAALIRPLLDGSPRSDAGDGEFPFLHGFFWLIGNLSERGPVVLAIDDAHWADALSLRAVLYLLHRLEDLAVCVVVTVRLGEPGATTELQAALRRQPGARLLRPAPLSRDAVSRIVGSRIGPADRRFVDACAEASGGNPFLLGELLAAAVAEGVQPTSSGAARVRELVPQRVLDATLARLARLGRIATSLAHGLAVLGDKSDVRAIAELVGVDPHKASVAADALAGAGIVRVGPAPSFAHPLLRAAVHASIGPAERARMHAVAARLLADRGAEPAVVAGQLLAAERAADPWAVAALRRAAAAAIGEGAPASAARYLARALEEPPASELRGEVLAELASAEAVAGEPQASDRLRAAIELLDDPRRRIRLRITLANALTYRGLALEGAAVLDAGRGEIAGAADGLALELDAAWISVARLEPSLRARAMPKLARLSEGLGGVTQIERVLLAHEANRRVFAGEPHTDIRELVRCAWADGALLEDHEAALNALAALGWCDDFDTYEQRLGVMQADAQRRGLVLAYADATYCLHLSHHYRGRLADAMADVELAIEARRYGWRRHIATASSQLSWTLIELGELDRAERVLQLPEIEAYEGRLTYALVHDARGRLALARGEPQRALEEFLHAGRIAESAPIANPSYLPWRSSAALAAARLGQVERASDLVAEELRRAERFGAPRPLGVALRASGLVVGGDEGIDRLRAAAETLAASPAGLEHARALTDLGAALRRCGRRRDARQPLSEGLELAIAFGARVLERRARDELMAAGARPRRRRFSGLEALTPSERRVADMAATGMTNRQIAEALFVTVKAVQWHLGNTYRKLGVSGRDELPAALGAGTAA